jgi:hypothetical protein
LDGSRKTSNKGEKRKEGDEKELEAISAKSEWVDLQFDIVTGIGFDLRSGGSGQEGRDGLLLLTFEDSKTVIEDGLLSLRGLAGLGGLLVIKRRRRGGVDGRVDKDRLDDLSGGSSRDLSLSKLEALGLGGERRVSLAGRRCFVLCSV